MEAAQGDDDCGPETFARWFEKFDAYLLNFYPEIQPEHPPASKSRARDGRYERSSTTGSERRGSTLLGRVRRRSSLTGRAPMHRDRGREGDGHTLAPAAPPRNVNMFRSGLEA